MRIYTTVHETYQINKGWIKGGNYDANETELINYNYVELEITPDGQTLIRQGHEDVPIRKSQECIYAEGFRILRKTFF